ncbi:hypothetical protein JCM3770_004144, partial [Rhodotorula araucariae]
MMAPRRRPPPVLVAFGALVLVVFFGSALLAPASELATATSHEAQERAPWWATRLAAARDGASSALDALHAAAWAPPSRPSASSLSPSLYRNLAPPPPLPSYAQLGFDGAPDLPECARTFLFRFHGARGFASEYLRFVRTAAVAQRLGYEVFLADEGRDGWMYGSIGSYFLPPANRTCRLAASAPPYAARTKMLPHRSEVVRDPDPGLRLEPDLVPGERYTPEALRAPRWSRQAHVADTY